MSNSHTGGNEPTKTGTSWGTVFYSWLILIFGCLMVMTGLTEGSLLWAVPGLVLIVLGGRWLGWWLGRKKLEQMQDLRERQ